ncbi:MAG: hypothetical protein IJM41_04870 [Bacteroidales bacterium]|nr:hypothetical protein [Bacteroidales bacterium]
MKTFKYILVPALILSAFFSCDRQDDIYKEYVKTGGWIYPAKAQNVSAVNGFKRVILTWDTPGDPSVTRAKIYWDNYGDSLEFAYPGGTDKTVSVTIENLSDRTYTFDIVNFDAKGNKSIPTELSATPYGDNWLQTHIERSVINMIVSDDGNSVHVLMSSASTDMVATRFRIRGAAGEWEDIRPYLKPGETELDLPLKMKGKKFQYQSAFLPSNSQDTAWLAWSSSPVAIPGRLDTSGWTVTATDGQVLEGCEPYKIFDGITDSENGRWHGSTDATLAKVFPKILAIDTKCEKGHEPTITEIRFWRSTERNKRYTREVYFYIGNQPYDPNAGESYASKFGDFALFSELYLSENPSIRSCPPSSGRYMSLVFPNSRGTTGYLDLWELEVWGYVEAEAE